MPLIRRLVVVFLAVVTATVVAVGSRSETTSAAPAEQRVLLVTDSVGLGARGALPHAFPPGWEVNTIGQPARFVHQLESQFVRPAVLSTPWRVGDHVVIAGGYNYEFWDPDRFDRSIDSMISTLTNAGVKNVYWVTLREVKPQFISASAWRQVQPYFWYFPTVNQHLRRALDRHPDLTLIDWAAAADRPGVTYDAIHLNRAGAALYSSLIADAVHNANTSVPGGTVTRVDVSGGTTDSAAVAVNLTVTRGRHRGHLTAYSCDRPRPDVSNLNHERDTTVAAAAIVPVGPSGEICIYNSTTAQIIVDLFGRFDGAADVAGADPVRLLDTRTRTGAKRPSAHETQTVRVVGPGAASEGTAAVALEVTSVGSRADGFVSVHPCDRRDQTTSNVNYRAGINTPNLVIAEPNAAGEVCVTASSDTHLIVDLFTAFGPAGSVTMIEPRRAVDTRLSSKPNDGDRVTISTDGLGLDDATQGVFLNLTITQADGSGFASAFPCTAGGVGTSNLNYRPGPPRANMVTVRPDSDGDICVQVTTSAHVAVDVVGGVGAGYVGEPGTRLLDTRN